MNLLRIFCLVLLLATLSYADNQTQVFSTSSGSVRITPLNHASTLIEAGGKFVYLDPAKPVDFSGKPKADLILITDIHGDHMDPDSIRAVSKNGTEILAPPAVVQTVTTGKAIANGETKTWHDWTVEAGLPKAATQLVAGFAVTRSCYCSFAYSALACFRMGISGSASFQRVRKS